MMIMINKPDIVINQNIPVALLFLLKEPKGRLVLSIKKEK